MPKRFPILFVADRASVEQYTRPPRKIEGKELRRNRASHGQRIQTKLDEAWKAFKTISDDREAIGLPARGGIYVSFRSPLGFELALKSLENIKKGIRLTNVKEIEEEVRGETGKVTIATVFIPNGEQGYFLKKVTKYLTEETKGGNPQQKTLIESIEDIELAVLETFWQDRNARLPEEAATWCEIWVRTEGNDTPKGELFTFCAQNGIEFSTEEINFPERSVYLIKANRADLTNLFSAYSHLAEIRKSSEPVSLWIEQANFEQVERVASLRDRLSIIDDENVRVLVLDTGINNGHQLVDSFLPDEDLHTYNTDWGKNDHHGHGTLMSGLAIYGSLQKELQHEEEISIGHGLESGKILPPNGENEEHLYGDITSQVISSAEYQNTNAKRIICLAVSVDDDNRGYPSSWSGMIDALASGYGDDIKRLFVIAAGNILNDKIWGNYPATNISSGIHTPAQAWNALSVGSYTQKTIIRDTSYAGFVAIAPEDGLSPFSSTSMIWGKRWPQKPDIVMEGGNAGQGEDGSISVVEDLDVLSLSHEITERQFEVTRATSAASAKAAHLCALIQTKYPSAWPETVRGLMVHSANWTDAMRAFFLEDESKTSYSQLLQCCGYGVPNPERALYCSESLLTLIAQEVIQPFTKNNKGSYVTKDVHYFELPWPAGLLQELGSTPVTMRLTLSYFIEPGPGEVGWKQRYRYSSYGLRFDVNNYTETLDNFRKRISKAARQEDEEFDKTNNSERWLIGDSARHRGSLHTDEITATAAEIAACQYIAIYPTGGWWKERTHLNRFESEARYSLIVTLETPEVEVDIYTEVANQIGVGVITL